MMVHDDAPCGASAPSRSAFAYTAITDEACYNLFRRAIEQRDADAWADISLHYRRLLAAWAVQCGGRQIEGEQPDDLADQALARAWAALSPAQFHAFPHLAALLAYLRACVRATVIDCVRDKAAQMRTMQRIDVAAATTTPEQQVLEQLERAELWRLVTSIAHDERERIVLHESLALALPPRAIQARHRDLFADVAAVYRTKRNLLNRLQRNRDLQRLRHEGVVV
jgi:DNA-directed RNA polymerase specialized sigma24 family protein